MQPKEKRLLIIALVMFAGYMVPFVLLPMVYNSYNDYWESLEKTQRKIKDYEKLAQRADDWKAENQRIRAERDQIEASLLQGETPELVSAKMQDLIRQLAQESGITFKSLDTPDNTTYTTEEWTFVIQSMRFEGNGESLMNFLTALYENPTKLEVISLDVRSRSTRRSSRRSSRRSGGNNLSRRGSKITGTIKVTGFTRVQPSPAKS